MDIPANYDIEHERMVLLEKIKPTRVGFIEADYNGSDDHIKYVTKRPEGDYDDDLHTITTLVAIKKRLNAFIQKCILTSNAERQTDPNFNSVFVWQIDADKINIKEK